MDALKSIARVDEVDFRLAHCKEELDRILARQNELLAQIHPELRQDFCMTRADRLRGLIDVEKENYWLLESWAQKSPAGEGGA